MREATSTFSEVRMRNDPGATIRSKTLSAREPMSQTCTLQSHFPEPRPYHLGSKEVGQKEPSNSGAAVLEMYDERKYDLDKLFNKKGFTNFGLWSRELLVKPITPESRQAASAELYRKVATFAKVNRDDVVVDLGCGRGAGSYLLAKEREAASVTGVDFSQRQLDDSDSDETQKVRSRVNFIRADLQSALPFDKECFDHAISVEVAQHLDGPDLFLDECFRILKPGGRLTVATFFTISDDGPDWLREQIPTVQMGIDRVSRADAFEELIESAGFEDLRRNSIGAKVFGGFDAWMKYVNPRSRWNQSWLTAYEHGLIDYFIFRGTKPLR
jgi:cyclopropane fatty-acyl-phospholipid synthase-like methyltransferase